jgi:integrase
VVVEIGRDSATGRRRQRWVSGFATEADAARALPTILHRARQSSPGPSGRETLAHFLRRWLAMLPSRGLRATTIDGYRVSIESQLLPRLGMISLAHLTPQQLNSCYAQMLGSGRRDGRGGLSPRTVRLAHTVLRRALADAVRWGELDRNVADNADPPRSRRTGELRVWSAAEVRVFLDSLETHPLGPCFRLLAATGMRRAEVLGLRWRDIDFNRARLSIIQTLVRTSEGAILTPPKTASGRRSIALDRRTLEILLDYRKQQSLNANDGPESDLVFHRDDGSPVPPHSLSKAFTAAVNEAGLPSLRLHDLRHTYASLALAAGVHVKVVSERLGHAGVTITLDIYSHVIPALDASAAEQIADLLDQHDNAQ